MSFPGATEAANRLRGTHWVDWPIGARERLEITFEVVTEGTRANIPDSCKRELFGPSSDAQMQAWQDLAEQWIGSAPVQGLAVGNRTTAGQRTGDLALVVFVDRKRPSSQVREPIPRKLNIPGLGVIETDVRAVGRLQPHQFPDRVRPAMPGCSIGHVDLKTMGTFGLLVRKQRARRGPSFVLSNAHVLALDGLATRGDDVVQPGPLDAGRANGTIAKLAEWIPFDFTKRGFPNRVDAAIASVMRAATVTNWIRELEVAPLATSFEIDEGMHVRKVGRSSDLTDGTVLFPSCKVKLEHMKTRRTAGVVRFGDQVLCTRYALPGDSGSAILNDQDQVIGLHAAGSFEACTFNKIEHVFAVLKLELA